MQAGRLTEIVRIIRVIPETEREVKAPEPYGDGTSTFIGTDIGVIMPGDSKLNDCTDQVNTDNKLYDFHARACVTVDNSYYENENGTVFYGLYITAEFHFRYQFQIEVGDIIVRGSHLVSDTKNKNSFIIEHIEASRRLNRVIAKAKRINDGELTSYYSGLI